MKKKQYIFLVLVLLIGSFLRIYGLGFGLPYNLAPDEIRKVNEVLSLEENHFHHDFKQPSFLFYSSYLFLKGYNGFASVVNTFSDQEKLPQDRTTYYYLMRLWMAILGILTIIITFLIARLLFKTVEMALLSAFFLSVVPLHVAMSHYIKEDIPMTFWANVTLLFCLLIVQRGRWFDYLLAGFFAGVTACTKYNGLLLVVIVGLAHLLRTISTEQSLKKRLIFFMGWRLYSIPLAFFLGLLTACPFFFTYSSNLIHGLFWQIRYGKTGHHLDGLSFSPWRHYFSFYLVRAIVPGLTPGVFLLSMAGIISFFCKKYRSKQALLLVSWIVLFYIMMEMARAKPYVFFSRYIMPIIPALCICGALGLVRCVQYLQKKNKSIIRVPALVFVVIIALYPAYFSSRFVFAMNNDTRFTAGQWINANLPEGAHINMWSTAKRYPLLVDNNKFTIQRKLLREKQLRYVPQPFYYVYSSFADQRFLNHPYEAKGDYYTFLNYDENYELIKEFKPDFVTYGYNNPVIRIYRIIPKDTRIQLLSEIRDVEKNKFLDIKFKCTSPDTLFPHVVSYRILWKKSDAEKKVVKKESWKTIVLAPDETRIVEMNTSAPEEEGTWVAEIEQIDKHADFMVGNRINWTTGTEQLGRFEGVHRHILVADSKKDEPGYLVFGPYEELDPGEYKAVFLIKAKGQKEDKLLAIDVFDNESNKVLIKKDIYAEEAKQHEWQLQALPFILKEHGTIEFRVLFYGNGVVKFDSVLLFGPDEAVTNNAIVTTAVEKEIKIQ